MNRRRFLAAALSAPLVGGCELTLDNGLFNECRVPDAAALARNPLVEAAWSGLRPDGVWDSHVHLFGNGHGDTTIYLDPEFESGWKPAKRMRHAFFMNAACAGADARAVDAAVVTRLAMLADALPKGAKLMLLAFDHTYDEAGRLDLRRTTFAVPNDYARKVAQSRPDRFEWICSVHPYRDDAVAALEQASAGGARAVKWLPPTMGIDLASRRCHAFYDALARLNLPLLVHMGEELAVPGAERGELANPLLVRHALDRGVRVIVAHCASLGASDDLDASGRGTRVANFALFLRLMSEQRYVGRLFGDVSAVTQVNRASVLPILLTRASWHGRLLNGSDYPLPGVMPLFSLNALVKEGVLPEGAVVALKDLRESHAVLFDFVLKRMLSYRGMKLPDSAFETRSFFEKDTAFPTPKFNLGAAA